MTFSRLAPLAALLLVFVSGCADLSSPEGVIGTVHESLQKNDFKVFKTALAGEAAAKYGTVEGMHELRERLAGLDVSAGQVVTVAAEQDERGWDVRRDYVAEVTARRHGTPTPYVPIMQAMVHCEIGYIYKDRWDSHGDWDCYRDHEGHWGYCHYDEQLDCRLTALTDF